MARGVIYWIFAICVLMGALLVAIMLADTVPNAGGVPHPDFAGMQVGADGAARLQFIGTYAFLFKSLLLALIVCLSILGVAERYRSTEFLIYMAASLAFMLFIWWQMYSSHQAFLETGETAFFMGFPVATAWQMYGTWLGAIPLVLIYSLGFNKFIYTPADAEAFDRLLFEFKQTEKHD